MSTRTKCVYAVSKHATLDLTASCKDWLSLGKRIVEIENNILKEERAAFERLRVEVHFWPLTR
jgi:hypothetical protein